MIPPPEITNADAKSDYLRAVQTVTGVWQAEVANTSALNPRTRAHLNAHIAKMWPLTFTPEQQQAILTEFMARRLSST